MKLWVDAVNPAPNGYVWIKSVNDAKAAIIETEQRNVCGMYDMMFSITMLDLNCDAGGNYIRLLEWIRATGRNYPIHIHSTNPVDTQSMREKYD